jgi:hypothetical protein
MPFTTIFQPPLLGSRMSGGTGYRAWYSAHASSTVRLPRPKPFAAAILREDELDIFVATRRRSGRGEAAATRRFVSGENC